MYDGIENKKVGTDSQGRSNRGMGLGWLVMGRISKERN